MEKIKFAALAILGIFLSQSGSAQSVAEVKNKLQGTWKIHWEETQQVMNQINRTEYQSIPSEQRANFEKNFIGRLWSFQADDNFLLSWVEDTTLQMQATWDVLNNGETIELIVGDNTLRFTIHQIDTQRLVIAPENEPGLFDKYCLFKQ
ncbi:MAG: hypothetical protein NW226_03400 [Microscillaceae bacterium]|nr:hypothetical protein [Microscillaceae bacterium]